MSRRFDARKTIGGFCLLSALASVGLAAEYPVSIDGSSTRSSRQSSSAAPKRHSPAQQKDKAAEPEPIQVNAGFANREAQSRIKYGEALAERGATFAARAKFVEALEIIALALDGDSGPQTHARELASGLKALDETDDFARIGSPARAVNLSGIVAKHQTPVLKDQELESVSLVKASQSYFAFAHQQLVAACGHEPVASRALCSLGRAWGAQSGAAQTSMSNGTAKAICLHQAALQVEPRNYIASNELGVLMSSCGRNDKALELFVNGLKVRETPEGWYNVSRVFEQNGDQEKAKRAKDRYLEIASGREGYGTASPPPNCQPNISWVQPAEFVAVGARVAQAEMTMDQTNSSDQTPAQSPKTNAKTTNGRTRTQPLIPNILGKFNSNTPVSASRGSTSIR